MGSRTAQICVTGVGIERYIGIYRAGKRKWKKSRELEDEHQPLVLVWRLQDRTLAFPWYKKIKSLTIILNTYNIIPISLMSHVTYHTHQWWSSKFSWFHGHGCSEPTTIFFQYCFEMSRWRWNWYQQIGKIVKICCLILFLFSFPFQFCHGLKWHLQ